MDDKKTEEELQSLKPNELVETVEPHTRHLEKQGELRDNDTIVDKQLKVAQSPVTAAANALVKLKLARDYYRAKWRYKDTYRADKWSHRDKVRQMRKERRKTVEAAKEAQREEKAVAKERRRNERKERREALQAAKEERRNARKERHSLSQKDERSE